MQIKNIHWDSSIDKEFSIITYKITFKQIEFSFIFRSIIKHFIMWKAIINNKVLLKFY
jgi:hypothetical protein